VIVHNQFSWPANWPAKRISAVKAKKGWTGLVVGKFDVGTHTDPDTDGLIMLVRPGARGLRRSWFYRYTFGGKRPKLGLGPYPAVGLAQARREARTAAEKVAKGVDPAESRASRSLTFREAAEAHIARALPRFKNEKSRHALRHALLVHCLPLHPRAIVDIRALEFADLLNEIATRAPYRVEAVRKAVRKVFAYAKLTLEDGDVILKDPTDPQRLQAAHYRAPEPSGRHHPALPYERIPAFMCELRAIDAPDARLLEFTILTGNRAGEARAARFDQIDVKGGVWRAPRSQLKSARFLSGEFFHVPLSARASEIIEEMRARLPRSTLVFPDSHDMTTIYFLRKLCRAGSWTDPASGRNISTHGFRTSFKGWAQKTKQDRAATELSLGHVYFGKVEGEYQPEDLLAERRELLDAWGLYCSGATADVQRLRA
jgi:integrase